MNSIWNNNFEAFKKRFPQLAQMTGSEPVPPESIWNLEKAKNQSITASEGGVRLHSAYNPEREASGAVGRDEVFQKSAVVFYGFGLGYHVIEFAKLAMERAAAGKTLPRLVLIEPDVKHFFAAMAVLDWTPVFTLENLIIAVGCPSESVLPLLEDGTKVNVGETGVSDSWFFDIPSFTAHSVPYFNEVRSLVKRNQRKNEINAATLKKFGKLWCRNSIKNMSQLENCAGISQLADIAASCPFLILGAGPSLETILPYIKEISERTITVCVETALHTLLRAGLQPDFILLTDPQFWAYRHIAGLEAPESILITEVSAYPSVFRFNCRKILLCGSQFPVGQYFEQKLGLVPGDLGTGGSVASSAWNFAHFCGAKEIYTAGLDFAFPNKQTHIKGSSAEQTYHTLSSRLTAPDRFTAASLYSANAAPGKDYNGSVVLTDSRMKMFSWWFEARLAACPETKTYTLCPQGLAVPGIQKAEVSELLKHPEIKAFKQKLLNQAENLPALVSNNSDKEKLQNILKNFPQSDFLTAYPFLKEYL
ncbi:motility associated factor glycosyltransferase family protein [Treponema bryantii]|nr:6-hydroxymethylpterin diphosphokinase MptE-like protein [Treponema bryantii]